MKKIGEKILKKLLSSDFLILFTRKIMSKLPSVWVRDVTEIIRENDEVKFKNLERVLTDAKQKDIKWFLSREEYNRLLRSLYQLILKKYPLMESIWIEYSEFMFKTVDSVAANEVYELAFTYLPRSLNLWNTWCQFQLQTQISHNEMFACLERARIAIADNYHAWKFYEGYLNYLEMIERKKITIDSMESTSDSPSSPSGYYKLLRLVIQIPLRDYLKAHELNFKMLEKATPSNIHNFINPHDLMELHKSTYLDLLNDSVKFKSVKTSLKKKFTELFIVVQYATWKRYPYEKEFKTSQYHPDMAMSRLELNKWRQYLEYSEVMGLKVGTKETEVMLQRNNRDWTDVLYNRCISITGNYHFFWLKWSNYHLNLNDSFKAKDVLSRALVCMNGGSILTFESLKIRSRLIDLHILDGEVEVALELALKVVDNLKVDSNSSSSCIVDIWIKVLEIVQMSTESEHCEQDILKIIDAVLPKCNNCDIQLMFLREVCEFDVVSKEAIMKYLNSIKAPEEDKKRFLKSTCHKESNGLSENTIPLPEGWECEFF